MVDQEVVDILAEIKERVSAAQAAAPASEEIFLVTSNQAASIESASSKDDFAGLTVLSRAWNRLPPVVSNRTGTSAKLELWIKAKLQRAMRWFTWEQVNFNAATNHTFLQVIESLDAYKKQLLILQSQMSAESKAVRVLETEIRRNQAVIDAHQAQQSLLQADLQRQAAAISQINSFHEQTVETKSRMDELVNEIRERDEKAVDEQRVCFKQLSLELSESQILEDRARRELEARLSRLEARQK
jgi:hypothetical protein